MYILTKKVKTWKIIIQKYIHSKKTITNKYVVSWLSSYKISRADIPLVMYVPPTSFLLTKLMNEISPN